MPRDRFVRGRSSRSRGGGGGGRGRGGGRRNGGGGRRYGRMQRNPRAQSAGGNERERIAIESGHLVVIDQFMLANPQFMKGLAQLADDDQDKKNDLIRDFGGSVVELDTGVYRIERDPFGCTLVIHQEGDLRVDRDLLERAVDSKGQVYVDTRCLAMIDRELLDDGGLLEKYQQLWLSGQDKACRDLLRDNGGAVRYGFQRSGDELDIYSVPDESIVCLWPSKEQSVSA